ncbi:hypothetical protein DPMN_034101 [Dreissena polymorpha]|uniref:Uncharacterized protein n=1 Tax=Dreissena polymorpha TaxID=45954 RepID=A0A9D4M7Z1_DREPO|nr:hypothetical protein DPMN_034101 [Dreissena polymorpha]
MPFWPTESLSTSPVVPGPTRIVKELHGGYMVHIPDRVGYDPCWDWGLTHSRRRYQQQYH